MKTTRSSQRLKGKGGVSSSSSKAKKKNVDDTPVEVSEGENEAQSPTGEEEMEEAGEMASGEAEGGAGDGLEGESGEDEIDVQSLLRPPPKDAVMQDSDWAPNQWATIVQGKHIEAMRAKYCVPEGVTMRAAEAGEMPGRPRPGEVAFCRSFFLAGVRLPLHPLFRRFLIFCGAAPLQVNPNVWKALLSCVILWRKHFNRDISLAELLTCFSLKGVADNEGVYYANSWNQILSNPVDAKVWRNNWFFVGGDWERHPLDENLAPKVHSSFHWASTWKNPFKILPEATQSRFTFIQALSDVERSPKSIITEENLIRYGLALGKESSLYHFL